MKRNHLLTGMLLASALLLAACGQPTPPPTADSPSSAATAVTAETPSTDSAGTPVVSAATTSTDSAATPDTGEQVATETTETGTATSAGPALALKDTTAKPEPVTRWKEGVHYQRLSPVQPTSALPGQIEVTEFFWYGCPHCNGLDPYLENWQHKTKAPYVSLVRIPIIWSPMHGLHARIFYTAQALGKLNELHTAIFDEFHKKQNPLNSPEKTQQFFAEHGVGKDEFQRAFTSTAVEASLRAAQDQGLRLKVESVPLIVINGKYVTDIGKAGGHEQLISLINDLTAREHGN